ncbi:Serine/threonine-protein kinase [Wickerhamomyces ciferrii]|uniref:Serine/threonine-protein kinase n=1 Tax=Wickerhamomyces ciferrii (strain ATCC 14091 / BCRC 22168 / CBS 111 / JCM 3599 / NBRC 0793 / NRRL Y-1031 F-60-10) TaxID=1206466 RepID=K0KFS8_WICCF|nr:Serine/threonine-protein kinase [Wickerhamomyces ciferrii]CCH41756.1 Serine/threonine-protein kinase [Wickerhamomyces ciferrii]
MVDNDYNTKSITDAINRIFSIQWNLIPTQLNSDFKLHIENYRHFLPKIVSRYQIYSIIPNNQTFVDQNVELLVEDGALRKFILHEHDDLNDLLMKKEDYDEYIQLLMRMFHNDDVCVKAFKGLQKFQSENLKVVKFSKDQISPSFITEEGLQRLIGLDLLEILPQSSSNKSTLKLSHPKYGYIINLYQKSKNFILKTISRNKWKEIKHNELYEKWESNKSKFKDFKGLNLYWILHWLIGEGILEIFKISDGTGYKIIRQ